MTKLQQLRQMTVLKHKFNHSRITIPKSEVGKTISRGIWRIEFECVNITNGVISKGESFFLRLQFVRRST